MRALIFDLDGTRVDTVYGHVLAWQRVLDEGGFPIEGWKVHRLIGMSGGLLTGAAARETASDLSQAEAEHLQPRHGQVSRELLPARRPLPGAIELLRHLSETRVKYGIATSGRNKEA